MLARQWILTSATVAVLYGHSFLLVPSSASDVVHLTDSNFDSVVDGSKHVFVKFYAKWCGYCRQMAPHWKSLATEWGAKAGDVVIAEVDIDESRSTSSRFGIRGIPDCRFFPKGNAKSPVTYSGSRVQQSFSDWLQQQVEQAGGSSPTVPTGSPGLPPPVVPPPRRDPPPKRPPRRDPPKKKPPGEDFPDEDLPGGGSGADEPLHDCIPPIKNALVACIKGAEVCEETVIDCLTRVADKASKSCSRWLDTATETYYSILLRRLTTNTKAIGQEIANLKDVLARDIPEDDRLKCQLRFKAVTLLKNIIEGREIEP